MKCVLTIDCQVYTSQNCLRHQEIIDDVLILMMLAKKLPLVNCLVFKKSNAWQEHPLSSPREGKVFFCLLCIINLSTFFSTWG